MLSTRLLLRFTKLFICAFSFVIISSNAHALDRQRSITLSATGTVSAIPDRAHISTAVETYEVSAKTAVQKNSEQMSKIIEALKSEGVEKKYIQTTSFAVQPEYESYKTSSAANRGPKIIGYRVTNNISITITDTKKLGKILDTVVTLGANRINGISFSVSNARKLADLARKKAIRTARKRALLYALSAGTRLGRVHTIRETSGYVSSGQVTQLRSLRKSSSVPVEAGSADVTVQVTVTWLLWK